MSDRREVLAEEREAIEEIDLDEHVPSFLRLEEETGFRQWFLITGNRLAVALVLLAVVFISLFAWGMFRPLEMRTLLTETTTVQTLFNTMLSGIILLVSIVVSVNSIVLSQELTSLEQQQGRVESSMEFSRSIEEYVSEGVAPTTPPAFLDVLLDTLSDRVTDLQEICAEVPDDELQADVNAFTAKVLTHIDEVDTQLEGDSSGTADILLAGLSYDYSWQLYAVRQLRAKHDDVLPEAADEIIGEFLEALKYFATGRGYFKTLYYEQEFANLSNTLLYVSLPAIVFLSHFLLALDAAQIPDVQILGVDPLMIYVIFAYTFALAPYIVFTSFLIRSTVVARRTLGAGPFVVRHDTVELRGEKSGAEDD
ncbi:hypothetical protein [Halostella sp. PRR32]|uniref:hypothetical protein n=1 Tax=Halostella sp. PRR32 TaxID=3098147 RepID=UPI002B1E0F68|nr:hypothetical protein [Halostella sp. PRR32]